MASFELRPHQLRRLASMLDADANELDQCAGNLHHHELRSGTFPLQEGADLATAYHEWLRVYQGSVVDDVHRWRSTVREVRAAADGYEGGDAIAEAGFRLPGSTLT